MRHCFSPYNGTRRCFLLFVINMFIVATLCGCDRDDTEAHEMNVGSGGGIAHEAFDYDLSDGIRDIAIDAYVKSAGCYAEVEVCYLDVCTLAYADFPDPDPVYFRTTAKNSKAIRYFEDDMEYCDDEFFVCDNDESCVDEFCLDDAVIDVYLSAPCAATIAMEIETKF